MTDSLIIAAAPSARADRSTANIAPSTKTRARSSQRRDMVTVAVRRVKLDRSKESLLDYIDPKNIFCCLTPPVATQRTKRSARPVWRAKSASPTGVKLEVIGDQATLFPDVQATLEPPRAREEGFTVLAYTSDDIVSPSAWSMPERPL